VAATKNQIRETEKIKEPSESTNQLKM